MKHGDTRDNFSEEPFHSKQQSRRIFDDSESEAPSEKLPPHVSMAAECRRKIRQYQQELRSRDIRFSSDSCLQSETSSDTEQKHGWKGAGRRHKESQSSNRREMGDIDSRLQELQSFLRAARQGLQQTVRT